MAFFSFLLFCFFLNRRSARNQILKVDLFLSMATFGVTSAGVVAGIFGMNLLSGFEEHPYAFHITSGAIAGIVVAFLVGSWQVMRWEVATNSTADGHFLAVNLSL